MFKGKRPTWNTGHDLSSALKLYVNTSNYLGSIRLESLDCVNCVKTNVGLIFLTKCTKM